jgi:lysophospholipase L1-like esterase
VLLQTLPPFDRKGEKLTKWLEVNRFVREELAAEADAFFDVVPILIDGPECEGKSKYNGHPNEQGCALWAQELLPVLKDFLERV